MKMKPSLKPQLTKEEAEEILSNQRVFDKVVVLAIRGYYKKTMGNPLKNDRGIYDDAIFIISPKSFLAFNANTDPSKTGKNKSGKGLASLVPGKYRYRPGKHKINSPNGYPAFIQADKVEVSRDGTNKTYIGYFGINIHKGSKTSTSSEGCLTIYPDQWIDFRDRLNEALQENNQDTFPLVLINNG